MSIAQQAPARFGVPHTARLLASFASYFEPTRAAARASGVELAALGLIIAAGAALRFWALGSVGLHGDEDTMALAAMHIVRHGTPLLPSGMLYTRGTLELYLMAASVMAFGATEWAFRLPSALCGVLLLPLAYWSGRRFLTPPWNLALTAACALLPAFVEDAQTARMYVFLVTSVAAFTALVFEWERTGRNGHLAAAAAVLIVGIEQHQLAIFASLLVLYPGLIRGDARRLVLGVLALGVILGCFFFISHWISDSYPLTPQLSDVPAPLLGPRSGAAIPRLGTAALIAGGCIALALGAWVARAVRARGAAVAAGLLIAVGGIAALLVSGHVALMAVVAALIIAARSGREALRRAVVAVAIHAAWLAIALWELHRAGVGLRQSIGALAGWPSPWPDLELALYSPVAMAVLAAGVVLACLRLARGRRAPDFFLFIALGVWVPLLLIGLFKWSVPIRYVAAESFPMLLGAFAAARWLACIGAGESRTRAGEPARRRAGAWLRIALPAVVCLLAARPASLARSAYGGYADHPDHQGAALFVRSQHPGPRDILVAEDVLEQTYYLGRVDYWLEGRGEASDFVHEVDGRLEDFYTDTPLIGTGAELERLIARRDRGAIYIIGSGEQQEDGRSAARGPQIQRILHSLARDVVYVGRDHLTKVWKIPPPRVPEPGGRRGVRG